MSTYENFAHPGFFDFQDSGGGFDNGGSAIVFGSPRLPN